MDAPFDRFMGIECTLDGDTVVATVDVDARWHNPTGRLHGGVIAGLADTAMGHLFLAHVGAGTNTDLDIRFLRPVEAGTLQAVARFVRKGRRVSLLSCDVMAGDRLVAVVQSQFVPLTR